MMKRKDTIEDFPRICMNAALLPLQNGERERILCDDKMDFLPTLILSFFLLFSFSSFSQSKEEGTKLLKEIFARQNTLANLKKGEVLHLKFKSKVSSTDPTLNGESTGELWQNKSNYFFKTESAEIYADQKDVFMLIPSRKLIYRMDMAGQKEKQEAMDKMMLMQDSLLYFSSIGTIKKMSGNLLRIELLMTQKGKKKYQLEKVIYEIDTKQKKITSAEVYYLAEAIKINKISHVTYTFLAQDLVAEPIHFKGTLTKKFLKGTGLNDSYKNYKIVDNRKEKLKEVKNKVGY